MTAPTSTTASGVAAALMRLAQEYARPHGMFDAPEREAPTSRNPRMAEEIGRSTPERGRRDRAASHPEN